MVEVGMVVVQLGVLVVPPLGVPMVKAGVLVVVEVGVLVVVVERDALIAARLGVVEPPGLLGEGRPVVRRGSTARYR